MVYVVQMLFVLLCGYFFRDDKKNFLRAAFIALFILMSFRNCSLVGYDSTSGYFSEFLEIKKVNLTWINPGLPFTMKIVHSFTEDYQWFIIITAIWICFAYYKLLKKYSVNTFISVMWFMGMLFYTFLFSALKQAWAMAFLCFAFDAIFEKKPLRFFLLVGLGALFHFPALIFLPAYFIGKLKVNKLFPFVMAFVLVFVFLFRTTILNWMTSAYAKGEGDYSSDTRFIGTKFVFMILILGYGFYQYYHSGVKNKTYIALLYFMAIAVIFQTFCFYNNIFERLADYYYQFSILFMPLIIKEQSPHFIKSTSNSNDPNGTKNGSSVLYSAFALSINSINLNNILSFIITVFCTWRYLSYMINDPFLSPFYFFWQGTTNIIR